MAAYLLRRAFPIATRSSPLIPPAVVSSSYGSRFLPFSSNQSPAVSYHNSLEKFKKELASASNGIPVPSGYPFDLGVSGSRASMLRSYGTKEVVVIKINGDDHPLILMDVDIRTGFATVSAKMTVKRDQLDVNEVNASDGYGNMGSYRDYLQVKGITPETINFLYQLLVYNEKRA